MMRIFRHGNDKGFALVDAIVVLFIASIASMIAVESIGNSGMLSSRHLIRAEKDFTTRGSLCPFTTQSDESK